MISKGFYLGSIIGGYVVYFVFSVIGAVMAALHGVPLWEGPGATWLLLGIVALIYLMVINLLLWWTAWKSIQDFGARTSPGQAVGFLFIPAVNIYWIFQAFWGFSKDYNSNIDGYDLQISRLSEGLFLAYTLAVLGNAVLFWVPLLSVLLNLAALVLTILVANKLVDAVNGISQVPRPESKGLVF
jgi:hypothetical protein